MRQWEIYDFPFPSAEQPHPGVIISPTVLAESPDYENVNVLICVSLRAGKQPKPRDVRLNGSDGLDGPTLVRCHFIHTFKKADAGRKRGAVTRERQRIIGQTIQRVFGFAFA